MHNKNNNKTQTFTQGLRPFSSSIPKTLKKYLKKSGYNYSHIVDNWSKMVSKKISDSCYPVTVKMSKQMKNGTLVLNVIHGKEMEVEYNRSEIKDKINSFFGYNCIENINLRVVRDKMEDKDNIFPRIKNLVKINDKMKRVKNEQLKNSLNNFLKAYNERNK